MVITLGSLLLAPIVISKYKPVDATTNPSLLLAAAQKPEYKNLFDDAIAFAKKYPAEEQVEAAIDKLVCVCVCACVHVVCRSIRQDGVCALNSVQGRGGCAGVSNRQTGHVCTRC